jgi:O-antigen ligase
MTGSRASFGSLTVAAGCLLLPVVRRPWIAAIWLVLLGGIAMFVLSYIDSDSAARMVDFSNTRQGVWQHVLSEASASPVFGRGAWMDSARNRVAWGNAHSLYIQVFYEIGIVGSLVFAAWLLVQGHRTLHCLRTLQIPEKWLIPAFFAIPLGIGVFEAGPLLGASSLALFWGFSVGLADRLPAIAQEPDALATTEHESGLAVSVR